MVSLLLAVIYLAFIGLGLPDSLLGSGWPIMHREFGLPISYMGVISMIISGGTILSSLMSERLTKRFGTPLLTAFSTFLTAAALFGFSTAHNFLSLCLWSIPYGLGAGAVDAALNNYVSVHYNSRHMSWLHCFWGVGAIISPYIMSFALSHLNWNNGYRIVSFLQIAIVIILILTLPLWNIRKNQSYDSPAKKATGIIGALKIKGVPCLLIGFFAYCAAESTVMLWTSSYLADVRGFSEKSAAAFASLFFIGITAGRFISGFISDKLGDRKMIRLGFFIAIIGILLILIPVKFDILVLGGFTIIGLGCAPVYPCIIHSTPANFGADNSQAIIGIQMASAYIGSTFMPPVFGIIANNISLKLMPFYIAAFFVLMIFMTDKTFGKVNERSRAAADKFALKK